MASVRTVGEEDFLAHRAMLYGLAYRLLGSYHDAEDVLQEAFLRWSSSDQTTVREPRRYLTTVVARLALDRLRTRRARRETYIGQWLPEPVATDTSPFFAGVYGRWAPISTVPIELNGAPALVVRHRDRAATLSIDVLDGAIIGIYVVANPDKLNGLATATIANDSPWG